MKKVYSLEYDHTSGQKSKQTTSITQLSEWLETALNDRYVSENSIILTTEIREEQ